MHGPERRRRACFAAIASAIIESYSGDARLERVMLFAALEGNEQGLAHHRNFSIPIFELLRDYIVRRQREGALAGYHPGAILAAIAGMAQRYAIYHPSVRLFPGVPPRGGRRDLYQHSHERNQSESI